ncbi:hypothetical protein BDZ94DRAFT_1292946 [Collybia nuda]|uniref:Inner centromere protein ARK-binding domain-containing protein n=1 Tax=Collybia nuda TaxID=64659 RepID=A0A9P6C8N8_9AGAR|nr:hypothetical protein BDZ94DRAFT_1292946 [Collybia nuda]
MRPIPHIGLLDWSNAVRLSMANDPGRQFFHDQVKTHGFLFLQDYMDNILCKTKSDSLIELVKTPGRKKPILKKPNPVSKLSNSITLSFEVDGSEEDPAPINTFHKALLTVKDANVTNISPIQPEFEHTAEKQPKETVLSAHPLIPDVTPTTSKKNAHKTELFVSNHPEPNELSIIAEDDEAPERSQISISITRMDGPPVPEDHLNATGSSSDTFYSIALVSPVSEKRELPQMSPLAYLPSTRNIGCIIPNRPVMNSEPVEECSSKVLATLMPTLVPTSDPSSGGDFGSMDASTCDPKIIIPQFPVLPAPVPLRKSIRVPQDPSVGMITPGATLGGRTSWLKKAREAKAMEGSARSAEISTSTGPPILPASLHNVLKRKSSDTVTFSETTDPESGERQPKSAKVIEGDIAPLKSRVPQKSQKEEVIGDNVFQSPSQYQQEGMLDRFKRTVEGLGARVGKSIGKPLGAGAAVSALAEARAAAEARVAERNNKEDQSTKLTAVVASTTPDMTTHMGARSTATLKNESPKVSPSRDMVQRLSISDLFSPNDSKTKITSKGSQNATQHTPGTQQGPSDENQLNRESITTTPPESPPATRSRLDSRLISALDKPPPVFIPPIPAAVVAGKGFTTYPRSLKQHNFLHGQSTLESIKPDLLFDDDAPEWPPTQNAELSLRFDSQSQEKNTNPLDEDDSWPVDEKLSVGVQWTFGVGIDKEDSMTWSTMPSQSQAANIVSLDNDDALGRKKSVEGQRGSAISDYFDIVVDEEGYDTTPDDNELEDMLSMINPIKSKTTRNEGQTMTVSALSSQSQPGFLGQTSKLISSTSSTSKKGKPGVEKVLQMAAVAAKKQQEESDKKATRLKEMENRRQLAMQRKAEDDKAKLQDRERKLKEEGERRKREREETTEKKPLKFASGPKKDDDNAKKRKITVEPDRKNEPKKPVPKSTSAPKSSMKQPVALSSSAAYNASLQTIANTMTNPAEAKSSKPSATLLQKGKVIAAKTPVSDDDLSQPSQLVQIQMAARAKAQLQAAKQIAEPTVQSESIELPDINSEYSDSEDEERPRTFNPPDWAQSPELRQALQVQSTINPDDIFGAIRPLKMEELFKTRTSRFRARTSSANWTGSDRLTVEEERSYVKRMGFR